MRSLFMQSAARLSDCGTYRYSLLREWDVTLPTVRWVMLNPSTADASLDDPTIRRCLDFARRWGAGSIEVYNLFALRSPSPKALLTHPDPVGPDNDTILRSITTKAGPVVVAWGVHGSLRGRDVEVLKLLTEDGIKPMCLGKTKDGHPRHPLFVPAETGLTGIAPGG